MEQSDTPLSEQKANARRQTMMDTIGAVLMLIIIIETIYILDLRHRRKRLENQIWYMRGEKPDLLQDLLFSELEDAEARGHLPLKEELERQIKVVKDD
jgi:hypothetical protein